MKIKSNFMLREVAGYYVVVPVGNGALNFNGVINLNESGATLWKTLENDATEEDLVTALMSEYEVDEERARIDVLNFVNKMKDAKLIEE